MAKRKRRGTNTGIPGLSFLWKRALGVTKAKNKIARIAGIPTTKSGRQRKTAICYLSCWVCKYRESDSLK